jgi:alkylation response protein AidB-like acyl-CoA dehydrogenase
MDDSSYGYMTDLPLESMVRIATGLKIGDGTMQMQKNLIASQILGKRFSQSKN